MITPFTISGVPNHWATAYYQGMACSEPGHASGGLTWVPRFICMSGGHKCAKLYIIFLSHPYNLSQSDPDI